MTIHNEPCVCCGERHGTPRAAAHGDVLCDECAYSVGEPSQEQLDAKLGEAVRGWLAEHTWATRPQELRATAKMQHAAYNRKLLNIIADWLEEATK